MTELEQAWAAREKHRAAEVVAQQADFNRLEAKLRKALTEAENRERQLLAAQEENARKTAHKMADVKVMQRRLKEEAEHQVALERRRVVSLEKQIKTLEETVSRSNTRLRAVEEEYEQFRAAQRNAPEAQLREQIRKLELRNSELQRRAEEEKAVSLSHQARHDKCRVQLVRVARELQRSREAQKRRAENDLQKLRVEYLAQEQRGTMSSDRATLRDIRRELESLRLATEVTMPEEVAAAVAQEGQRQRYLDGVYGAVVPEHTVSDALDTSAASTEGKPGQAAAGGTMPVDMPSTAVSGAE